jgi:hypothetical protein
MPDDYEDFPESLRGVVPNVSAAKMVGTLNIVFAAVLLLFGICCGLQFAAQTTLVAIFGEQQREQIHAEMKAQRDRVIQELKDQEKAATTQQEKTQLQAQRNRLEAQPVPKMPDFAKVYGTDDPRIAGGSLVDIGTGILLNILMLIAGIGLVAVKEWGRKMGIWIAVLKILRLLTVYPYWILIGVPIVTARIRELIEETAAGQGGPPQHIDQAIAVMGTVMTVGCLAMLVLGLIYPVAVLIALTRPSVKAACRLSAQRD